MSVSKMIAEAQEIVYAKVDVQAQASLDVTHADLIACQWIDIDITH
jgi:hypothetical protein